jgi:hypothetical protein
VQERQLIPSDICHFLSLTRLARDVPDNNDESQ